MTKQNKKLVSGVMIKELVQHKDERGFFEEFIRTDDPFFKEGFGQWSHSLMNQNVIKAWHIHKTQIDWWYIARGTVKAVLYDTRKDSETFGMTNEFFMGENADHIILKIPHHVAHGVKVLQGPSELMYITSKVYDPQEEGRIPYDDATIGYDWLQDPPRT